MDALEISGTASPGKSRAIRRVVSLRHVLRRWRDRACCSGGGSAPADVPSGHVAVRVGSRRFVVRAAHLNHPTFRALLAMAEEEYGFAPRDGPIAIPCDEAVFEEVLRQVMVEQEEGDDGSALCCATAGRVRRCELSLPLLRSVVGEEPAASNSVW